jgi:hypothetical protein
VADEEDMDLAELTATKGASERALVDPRGLDHLPHLPMRTLDRPRDHVLEAAEDRSALPGGLIETEPIVLLDIGPAPGAALAHRG